LVSNIAARRIILSRVGLVEDLIKLRGVGVDGD
jgi:hypothetical protein